MDYALAQAKTLVSKASLDGRKIKDKDKELAVVLIRKLSEDPDWILAGNNQGRRLYHLLHLLSSNYDIISIASDN